MAEWAQHWETVNGPVITAVYTGFCFSNLDIHKSLCFSHLGYVGSCAASNDALWTRAVTTLIVGLSVRPALLKMKWAPFAPLFLAVTLPESCCYTLHVKERSISLAESQVLPITVVFKRWKIVRVYNDHIYYNARLSWLTRCANSYCYFIIFFCDAFALEDIA